jgi:hypothetical protein
MEGTVLTDRQLRVVVCDDDDVRAADWADRINDLGNTQLTAEHLPSERFGSVVAALKDRKAHAKLHGTLPDGDDAAADFDSADVLVLDSDLTPDAGSSQGADPGPMVQQHLVGELGGEVAHLARCYSTAGALMVVNQKWKRRSFDLTLLTFANDVAEVYVSEMDLDNEHLWMPPSGETDHFRPWSWPVLTQVPSDIAALVDSVSLDRPVLSALGLDGELATNAFTDRQLDALEIDDWQGMTFADVARDSAMGLRLKETVDPGQELRVAVCAVRRWLDRHVLPSHNVLIDAPHLLQRRPWTVDDRSDLAAWNDPASWLLDVDGTAPTPDPAPDAYLPEASRWLGRHVWLWPMTTQVARRPEWRILPTDPVFCEDTSAFVPADEAADFLSDLQGPSGQRFVRTLGDVDYHPRRRLLT